MKSLTTFVTLVVLIAAAACSGNSATSPAATTPPPPQLLPNYTGVWSGTYTVTTCTETGDLASAGACASLRGSTAPFQLNAVQTALVSPALVQGTFTLGTIPFTITPANIASTGSVTFFGNSAVGSVNALATWTLTTPIVGTISDVWTIPGYSGQVSFNGTINTTTKVGSIGNQPTVVPRSIDDLVRGTLGR